jgi:hypothetical protein
MILNGKTQLGLAFDKYMADEIFNMHYDKYISQEQDFVIKTIASEQVKDLFNNENNKNYIFRQTALDIASKIKLDKGKFEDLSFITDKLPAKKCTYLMGRDKFYRWFRWGEGTDIMVICVKFSEIENKEEADQVKGFFKGMTQNKISKLIEDFKSSGKMSQYEYEVVMSALTEKDFSQHIGNGIFYYMWGIKNGRLHFPPDERNQDFYDEMMLFTKLLIFTELSDIETIDLSPKQSSGTKKQGKILNESNKNVRVIDSSWNKILVKGQSFNVRGHVRLQPYGPGLKFRRLQYIDEFEKQGYTRNALKETI